jgi:hypothetical protein
LQLPHLKKHMRCIHKTENPYMCLRCRNFFKKKAELDSHVELCKINETLPPGKCNISTQTEEEFEVCHLKNYALTLKIKMLLVRLMKMSMLDSSEN